MAAVIKDAAGSDDIRYLIKCKKDLTPLLHPSHQFIRNILRTWASVHNKELKVEQEIQREMLWDNCFIQIQQKTVAWSHWRDAGILYINDLLHEDLPRFLSHAEFRMKFGITVSFLESLQIRSAIPCLWKRKLMGPAQQEMVSKPDIYTAEGESVSIIGKSSKSIYCLLIRFLNQPVTSQVRWNDLFPMNDADVPEYWQTSTDSRTRQLATPSFRLSISE